VLPIECPHHQGSFCLNYCTEEKCLKFLCEECIAEHLRDHKNNGVFTPSIDSVKKVREHCVEKLQKLIQSFRLQM
jgi:hypothetical protein